MIMFFYYDQDDFNQDLKNATQIMRLVSIDILQE